MTKLHDKLSVLKDERAIRVLAELHQEQANQAFGIGLDLLPQMHRWLRGRPLDWSRLETKLGRRPLAVDVDSGVYLYLLARSTRARHLVEFGASVGVSAIYLTLAARENGGRLITTELSPDKVTLARRNLERAGLADYAEVRQGDATSTLRGLEGPVDFLHNDGFPRFVLPVLRLLAPRMQAGAVALCGNAALFPADHADYVAWVRAPENGFTSTSLPMKLGGEFSVRGGRDSAVEAAA
jgi:predicted O-methyltransferase YrrM